MYKIIVCRRLPKRLRLLKLVKLMDLCKIAE